MPDEEDFDAAGVRVHRVFSDVEAKTLEFLHSNIDLSSWTSLCAQGYRHAGTSLNLLVLVVENCTATAYKDVLDNSVLPGLGNNHICV